MIEPEDWVVATPPMAWVPTFCTSGAPAKSRSCRAGLVRTTVTVSLTVPNAGRGRPATTQASLAVAHMAMTNA